MPRRLPLAWALGVLPLVACALFPSLGELTTADASTSTDASTDKALCDGVDALVCTDFDHGGLLAGGWTNITVTSPNVLALDDASSYSAPYSLHAAQNVDASAVERLIANVPPSTRRIHATMQLFIPSTLTLIGVADPFEILCADDNAQKFSGFWLRLFSGGGQIWTLSGSQKIDVAIPENEWTRFDIDVRYGTTDAGAPSHMTVAVDSTVQIDVDTNEAPCALPRFEVNLGLGGNGVFSINADDVIVRVE